GGKTDDDSYRSRGVALRPGDARHGRERGNTRCKLQKSAARGCHGFPPPVPRTTRAVRGAGELSKCRDARIMLIVDQAICDLWSVCEMQLSDRIGRRMKLQDPHVLMTVVQAGSMRKAARVLNTSQPAISRSIAELENAIGVRLLDRDPKGVEPTAYGRALLDGGIAMFDELRQAVKNIEFLADSTAGEVRVGCPSPVAGGGGAARAERVAGCYPRVRFHVVEGDVIALQREMHERNIDLAIGPVREPINDENLISEILFDDRLVVAA